MKRKHKNPIFNQTFKEAMLSGESVEVDVDGDETLFRLDRTHGECVCRIDNDEETPLFSAKYLEGEFE